MALKIRLARIGRKKKPMYRIVAINEQSKRNGAALEVLGTYNPLKNQFVQFHAERIAFWMQYGAVQTDAVKRLVRLHVRQSKMAAAAPVAPVAPAAEEAAVASAQ